MMRNKLYLIVCILIYLFMPVSVLAQEKTDVLDWLKMKSSDWCRAQQKMSFNQISAPPMHFDFQFTIEKGMQACRLIINEKVQNTTRKTTLVLPNLNPDIVVEPADRIWNQYLEEKMSKSHSDNESRQKFKPTYQWMDNPWGMIIYANSKKTPIESENIILATGKTTTERLNCAMVIVDNEAHARQIALVMKRLILGCHSGEY